MRSVPKGRNPYVGPLPFKSGEKLYGRERETRELLDLLIAERIVLLHSPSGAGKTSLLQAALIPRLRERRFTVLPVMRVNRAPKDQPAANRFVLSALSSLEDSLPSSQRLAEQTLASLSLDDYLQQRAAQFGGQNSQLLIFDQFEESLNIDPADRASKEAFFAQVGAALLDRRRWALFAIREDYMGGLAPFLRPLPTQLSNTFRLDLLDVQAARQAIQRPARDAGIDFTDAAAEKLVDDLRRVQSQQPDGSATTQMGLYVEPVQLQVVCLRLWDKKAPLPGATIGESDLSDVGAVDAALADYYAEQVAAIAGQTGVRERAIREWFERQLITAQGVRGEVLQEPRASRGLQNDAIQAFIQAYIVRAEERRGTTWFELAHDRLIAPIRDDNTRWFVAHLSAMQKQAELWNSNERQSGFLLTGQALVDAQQWATVNPLELTNIEKDFLRDCGEARVRADREQRQNETIWRRGVAATVVSAIALLALVGALFFYVQAKTAAQSAIDASGTAVAETTVSAKSAQDAAQARGTAVAEATLGAKAAQEASQARATAVSARNAAIAQFAASLAAFAVSSIGSDPERGLLLAMRSISETYTVQGEEALHLTLEASHIRRVLTDTRHSIMRDAAFSPDGQQIVSVGENQVGLVSNAVTGERLFDLKDGHGVPLVLSAAYNTNGSLIVTAGGDHNVILWDARTGARRKFLGDHADRTTVNQAEFSPDGRWIVSAGTDRTARIWDVGACLERDSCHSVLTFTSHISEVNSVAFDPSGEWVASGSQDGSVRIWNRVSAEEKLVIQTNEIVHSVAFSPRGDKILTALQDGTARIWDAQTGAPGLVLRGHAAAVLSARYNAAGDHILTAGNDGLVIMWDSIVGSQLLTLHGHGSGVFSAGFSPDGQSVVSASIDKTVRVWDASQVEQSLLHGHTRPVLRAVFSADGTSVATASEDRTARVWDTLSGKELARFDQHQDTVLDVAFSPDGRFLATASADNNARIWDIAARTLVATLHGHTGDVTGVAYSPDGSLIATSSADKSIRLWSAVSGAPVLGISTDYRPVGVAWSPDGTLLLSGDSDPNPPGIREKISVQLWDAGSGRLVRTVLGHSRPVFAASFSPDGRMFVTAGGDTSIRIWDVASGNELKRWAGPNQRITSAVFSPDGLRVMTVARDSTVRFWDLASDQEVMRLRGSTDQPISATYSRDGKYFLIAGSDGDVRIYLTRVDDLIQLARTRVTRDLTCAERQRNLHENISC